jgi:hypothetical protein
MAAISSEQTKLYYVISQLEHQYASEVEDTITIHRSETLTQF